MLLQFSAAIRLRLFLSAVIFLLIFSCLAQNEGGSILATVQYNNGVKSFSQGNYRQAEHCFDSAIHSYYDLKCCDSMLLLSFVGKGMVEVRQGKLKEAIQSYRTGEELIKIVAGFPELEQARLFNNMSLIYKRLSNNQLAIDYLYRSMDLKEKLNPTGPDLATGWNNLAQMLEAEGKFELALHNYDLAEGRFRQLNDYEHLLQLLSNKGMLLDRLGKTSEAIVCLEYAEHLCSKIEKPDKDLRENLLKNLGRLHYSDGNYSKSVRYYEDALSIGPSKEGRISILTGLGMAFERNGMQGSADSVFRLMMMARDEDKSTPSEVRANALLVYGKSLLKRDSTSVSGFSFLQLAVKEFTGLHGIHHFSVANASLHFAEAYLKSGEIIQAINICNSALNSLSVPLPENEGQVPDFEVCRSVSPIIIDILELKAEALRRSKENNNEFSNKLAALEYYQLTIRLMQYYRKGMSAKSNLRWSKLFNTVYESAIILAAELKEISNNEKFIETEFNLIEWSKANILRNRIDESNALSYSGLSDTILSEYESLRQLLRNNIFVREKELAKPTPDYQAVNTLDSLISLAFYEVSAQESQMAFLSPSFRQWTGDYRWLNLTDIQRSIGDNESVLQYFTVGQLVYVVVVSSKRSHLVKWNSFTQIDSVSNVYLRMIKTLDQSGYEKPGGDLYQAIFQPVKGFCEIGSHLIILPDSKCSNIPYELLITGRDTVNGRTRPHYLVEDHLVKYGFTAASINMADSMPEIRQYISAFIPDPGLSSATEEADEIKRSAGESGLAYNCYQNETSTKATFAKQLESESVVHVSTHGFADMDNPDHSCLVFASDRSRENKSEDDSLLYAGEICNLHSRIPLLVLNACETGKGKVLTGEGSMSLARAFSMAGTRKIVCTLWRVNDREASGMMKKFYEFYFSGEDAALALQKAKLYMLRQENQFFPRNWGAYIYYGR